MLVKERYHIQGDVHHTQQEVYNISIVGPLIIIYVVGRTIQNVVRTQEGPEQLEEQLEEQLGEQLVEQLGEQLEEQLEVVVKVEELQ